MTRPLLSFADLPGRRVGLYGLGVEGQASLRACRARGIEPVIVDDSPSATADINVIPTADGGLQQLLGCDVVIKSPGISRYSNTIRSLMNAGVVVTGGLGLWFAGADLARTLLITGTKGKSTTTAIAGHLLRGLGYRPLVGGNIGVPPYDPAVSCDCDFTVVEVSSYQATDLPVTPPVTAVTSLGPDHLPWHDGDVETYYRDKLSALSQPGARRTIANGDSEVLRAHEALLGPTVCWVHAADTPDATWTDQLGLPGPHNRRNALIAARALDAMGVEGAADGDALAAAATGFEGLPSRLQIVGRRGDVTFVDDNLSTNVLPVLAALDAFDGQRVALLVGGQSRGIDYGPLGIGVAERMQHPGGSSYLVVTMPTNGPEIRRQMLATAPNLAGTIATADSLQHAVNLAAAWARPDGVVLLSPAAPSFDLFADYRDRGAHFAAAVENLPT